MDSRLGAQAEPIRLNQMSASRLLLSLLGVLLIVADILALRHAQPFPHPTAALLLGLVIGQVGLVASWAACSRQSWLVRISITWSVAALAAGPLAMNSSPTWREWAALLLMYATTVVVAWKLTLAAGYRWLLPQRRAAASALKDHQFSLAWMLRTVTTASLALGASSWLMLPVHKPHLAVASMLTLALFVPMAFAALLLKTDRWWLRGMLALILPVGVVAFLVLNRGASPMFFTLLLGVQTLVTLLAATVLAALEVQLVPATPSTSLDEPQPSLRLGDAP